MRRALPDPSVVIREGASRRHVKNTLQKWVSKLYSGLFGGKIRKLLSQF
jgi:hypothetical protein